MTARSGKERGTGTTPASMPEGTPNLASPHDHSFTLQAIMEMQKTVGALAANVERLSSDVGGLGERIEAFGDKLDKVRHWQAVVSGGAIVVAAVVAIAWTVITFVPWDRVHIDTGPKTEVSEKK